MGLWNSHRQRQAGKYAKKAYQLEVDDRRRATHAAQREQFARDAALDQEWFNHGWYAFHLTRTGQPIAAAPVDSRAYGHYRRGWDAAAELTARQHTDGVTRYS